jgi:hypothetical protein
MEPEGSLPRSQELTTCPYPEPNQPSPYPPSYLYKIFLILSTHLCLGLPTGLFSSGFPTNNLYVIVFPPFTLHAHPTSSSVSGLWIRKQFSNASNRTRAAECLTRCSTDEGIRMQLDRVV